LEKRGGGCADDCDLVDGSRSEKTSDLLVSPSITGSIIGDRLSSSAVGGSNPEEPEERVCVSCKKNIAGSGCRKVDPTTHEYVDACRNACFDAYVSSQVISMLELLELTADKHDEVRRYNTFYSISVVADILLTLFRYGISRLVKAFM
jgi:hypothetical protein